MTTLSLTAHVSPAFACFLHRAVTLGWVPEDADCERETGFAYRTFTEEEIEDMTEVRLREGAPLSPLNSAVGVISLRETLKTQCRCLLDLEFLQTKADIWTSLGARVGTLLRPEIQLQRWQQLYIAAVWDWREELLVSACHERGFVDLAASQVSVLGATIPTAERPVWYVPAHHTGSAALPLFAAPGAGKTLVFLALALLLTEHWEGRCLIVAPPGTSGTIFQEAQEQLSVEARRKCKVLRMSPTLLKHAEHLKAMIVTPTTLVQLLQPSPPASEGGAPGPCLFEKLDVCVVIWDEAQLTLPYRSSGWPLAMSTRKLPRARRVLNLLVSGTPLQIAEDHAAWLGLDSKVLQMQRDSPSATLRTELCLPIVNVETLGVRLTPFQMQIYQTLITSFTSVLASAYLCGEIGESACSRLATLSGQSSLEEDSLRVFHQRQQQLYHRAARFWDLAVSIGKLPTGHPLQAGLEKVLLSWAPEERTTLTEHLRRWTPLFREAEEAAQPSSGQEPSTPIPPLALDGHSLQLFDRHRSIIIKMLGINHLAQQWCLEAMFGNDPESVLQRAMENLTEANRPNCVVCWEPIDIRDDNLSVYQPCMHGFFCGGCAREVQRRQLACPLDRGRGGVANAAKLRMLRAPNAEEPAPTPLWQKILGPKLGAVIQTILEDHQTRGPHQAVIVTRGNGSQRLVRAFEQLHQDWPALRGNLPETCPLEAFALHGSGSSRAVQLGLWKQGGRSPKTRVLLLAAQHTCQEIVGLNLQAQSAQDLITVYLLTLPEGSGGALDHDALLQTLGRFKRPGHGQVMIRVVSCAETFEEDRLPRDLSAISELLDTLRQD